jgi:hypothetical protein
MCLKITPIEEWAVCLNVFNLSLINAPRFSVNLTTTSKFTIASFIVAIRNFSIIVLYISWTLLLLFSCRWIGTVSVNCGQQQAYCLFPRVKSHDGMILIWENRRTERETCPSATLYTTTFKCADPGVNPDPRDERPATNRLSHSSALCELSTLTHFHWQGSLLTLR